MAVSAGLVGAQVIPLRRLARAGDSPTSVELMRENWQSLVPADSAIATSLEPLTRSRSEWQELLDEQAYQVLFEDGTEPPFSSPLNGEKRPGVYACAACSLPLFTSEMKYDSGTGWPSFITHIPGHLATRRDFTLIWPRTEYHCIKCGGHQGHVFDDGPPPTGERWCNNGVALRFIAVGQA
jgi:peptide-methionine (R)-S-oxide reductase